MLEEINQELPDVLIHLDEAGDSRNAIEESSKRIELHLAKLESQRQILESMDASAVFDLSPFSTVVGTLDDLITINQEHVVAIRSVLADRIRTIVVDGQVDLWNLTDTMPANSFVVDLQTVTAQALDESPESASIIGWANEFVMGDESVSGLVDLLLGSVLLVSGKPEEAYKIARELPPGFAVVTNKGLIAHSGGLLQSPAILGEELLERRQELKRIEAEIAKNVGQQEHNKEQAAAILKNLTELRSLKDEHTDQFERLQTSLVDSERRLYERKHALNLAVADLEQTSKKQEALYSEIGSLEERTLETEQLIKDYNDASSKFESSIKMANLELRELPAVEIADERRHLEQAVEAAKTIVAGRQAVVDSRRATLVQIDEQLDRIGDRIKDLRAREVDIQLEEHRAVASRLQSEMDTLKSDLAPIQDSLREKQDLLSTLESNLSEQLIQNQAAENQYLQARLSLNQADNRVEGLRERITTDLGLVDLPFDDDETAQSPLPIKDVVEHLPAVEELPEDLERTIQRLRGQLHRMGGINPEAPSEYEETRQRHEFLSKQVMDLNATIEQLQVVIIELDELTSKAFVETVRRVDENFGEVFRRLFGGGTGRLVLTDPDHLTSTGVDIVARLPNRREQALGLLSGGERSLTATALIFSLLMVSPTPFCVLDEVDAMLDEANINRFREMLQELSQNTQFIIITHNRGTVQVAESVYGVSMGADSASQVISIKPEEYVGFSGID